MNHCSYLILQQQQQPKTMLSQMMIKTFILLYLLFNFSFSGRADNYFNDGVELNNPTDEVMNMHLKGRKLMIKVDAMVDYQDPGPNPTHEPPKRGGGRGGGN
ncbi:hypothetical protein FNV43_RR09457 [Rhamnella rubrinervis]|uniref:Uncharacterized protein n=1 Tax=Rhamnella rubrinervis TaxID=2594499 RepID=A0A8K0MJT2_9ROSA|nr:hypothetical protein FNV43_RR09457 [Rhamnella rubrinervis]